jgi:small-conductance mechanosensitive channel
MSELWERLAAGLGQLLAVLPPLIAAILILSAGYFIARQLERWTDALLERLDFNKMAEAGGLSEAVDRTGMRLDPVRVIGKLLFWLVMLVAILLASTALGLESINEMFRTMLSYIPTLFASVVIVILGMIVGEFVRGLVLASAGGVEGVPILAKVAKATVVLIAVFMAAQTMGIAAEIITAAFTVVLGAIGLAVGLAFGIGNTELAGVITRRWYEAGRRRRRRRFGGKPEVTAVTPAEPAPPPPASTP